MTILVNWRNARRNHPLLSSEPGWLSQYNFWLRDGGLGFDSDKARDIFPFATMSEQALRPNKLAQAVALLTCILEVLTLNPGRNMDDPDCKFSWFYIVPPGKCRSSTSNYATISSFHALSSSLFTNCNRPIIRRCRPIF
jgi:hypothetical protein